jgi:hypothetical protein
MSETIIGFFYEPLGIHIGFFVLTVYPVWHIFRRVGLPGYWALLIAIPLVGWTASLVALVAQRWPNAPPPPKPAQPSRRARRESREAG